MSEFQIRSEETGIASYPHLEEAMFAAKLDLSIWKISYTDQNGDRIRLVRQDDGSWKNEPIEDILDSFLGEHR